MDYNKKDELTECFGKSSKFPSEEVVTNSIKIIARFLMKAYNSRVIEDYDDGRFQLFEESTTNDLRYLPPYCCTGFSYKTEFIPGRVGVG